MKYEFHPLAKLFPMLPEKEREALKEDIQKNKQQVPVIIYQGKVLDGRNRIIVCEELGIEPITEPFKGNNPFEFVLSMNLLRRHLDESQRAMIAVELATTHQGQRTDLELPAMLPEVSQAEAAKLCNVSERLVRDAKKIKEKAPDRVNEIIEGRITVSKVIREIRTNKKKKRENRKPKRRKHIPKQALRGMFRLRKTKILQMKKQPLRRSIQARKLQR